jgi:hypothetical protein
VQVERQGKPILAITNAIQFIDPLAIVIKIFGIYTHAQIDKRLWDSMGRQLGRKGKEYRDRCTFRNRPHHAGDNVILPACFPPPEKTADVTSVVPELPKEDLEEVSESDVVVYTAANPL